MEIILAKDEAILSDIAQNLPGAIKKMNAMGNYQWDLSYPLISDFTADLEQEQLYLVQDNGINQAVFVLSTTYEEHYYQEANSFVFKQKDDRVAYIHRMFMFEDKTVRASEILEYIPEYFKAEFDAIQIDTNNKNIPMLKAIIKAGYEPRGNFYRPKEKPLCPAWTTFEFICK